MDLRVILFRAYKKTLWLYEELDEGRLRQGWGACGLSLKRADGRRVAKVEWDNQYGIVAARKKTLDQPWDAPRPDRFKKLCRMLELKYGDVVVVPKMPQKRQFTIARVGGCYRFQVGKGDDFGHIVPVCRERVCTFDYRANADTVRISQHFGYGGDHIGAVSFCGNACGHPEVAKSCYRLLQLSP